MGPGVRQTSANVMEWPITAPSIVSWPQDGFFPVLVNTTRDCTNKARFTLASRTNHGTGNVSVTVRSGRLSLWTAFFLSSADLIGD